MLRLHLWHHFCPDSKHHGTIPRKELIVIPEGIPSIRICLSAMMDYLDGCLHAIALPARGRFLVAVREGPPGSSGIPAVLPDKKR